MEPAQSKELLGPLIVVLASLVALVYVFLRFTGVFRHRHRGPDHRGMH